MHFTTIKKKKKDSKLPTCPRGPANAWTFPRPALWPPCPPYLAEAVENNQDPSEEVAVGGVIPHDVFIPQLDGDKRSEQLAQLLNDQIELSLQPHRKHQLLLAVKDPKDSAGGPLAWAVMTFQVTGRPLISFGKHSDLLLMGLRYGRGDVAPACCPHPLSTSPEEQSSEDSISGREKLDTSVGGLECGSLPGACCGFGGTVPGPTHRLPWSRGLTQASWGPSLRGLGWMDNRTHVRAGLEVEREMRSPSQLHHLLSARRQEGIWAKGMHLGFRQGRVRSLCCCKFMGPSLLIYRMGTTTPILLGCSEDSWRASSTMPGTEQSSTILFPFPPLPWDKSLPLSVV